MAAIQIRSQVLRHWQSDHAGAIGPFMAIDEADRRSGAGEAAAAGRWRQRDVEQAIAVARQAGLTSYRVEIARDGTIAIVVGAPLEPAT